MNGFVRLGEVDTLLSTWVSFRTDEELPLNKKEDGGHEVLQSALARTVRTRPRDTSDGKCRVSGVPDPSGSGIGNGSGKPQKVKNRVRKKVNPVGF